jgi:hypothetical protein
MTTSGRPSADDTRDVARSLRALSHTNELARGLIKAGMPTMVLKGPQVQARLLGDPANYPSADVDLLVRPQHGRRARAVLKAAGWTFARDNGRLWRVDRAAAFERGDMVIDLHWGLHAHLLAGRVFRPLEDAMWAGAVANADGVFEPPLDALTTYLAVHTAGQGQRPGKLRLLAAAAAQSDRAEVERLARACHVWPSVEAALDAAQGTAESYSVPDPSSAGRRWPGRVIASLRMRVHRPDHQHESRR